MSEVLAQLEKKGGGDMSETVLWTNPNPTSGFSATTVTLSQAVTDFKFFKYVYRVSTTDSTIYSIIMSVEDFVNSVSSKSRFCAMCSIGSQHVRALNYISPTSFQVELAYKVNSVGTTNTAAIPQAFIGLK